MSTPGREREMAMMVDPEWEPTDDEPDPPRERVVGGWILDGGPGTGLFVPNPEYVPITPGAPTDPVDAVLQGLARGDAGGDELIQALGTIAYTVAIDEEGAAMVVPAPDDVPSVPVVTAPQHAEGLAVDAWRAATLEELAAVLPPDGVDLLINPGGPASMRVLAESVRAAVAVRQP